MRASSSFHEMVQTAPPLASGRGDRSSDLQRLSSVDAHQKAARSSGKRRTKTVASAWGSAERRPRAMRVVEYISDEFRGDESSLRSDCAELLSVQKIGR